MFSFQHLNLNEHHEANKGHRDAQNNVVQHNDIKHYDTQHKKLICDTHHK